MDVSRNFTNREVCEFYYVKDPAGPKPDSNDKDKLKLKWTCDCGNCVKLVAEGSGYSNLMDHITRDHPDYLDVMRASTQFEDKSIAKFMIKNPITSKANWIYSWLEWVVMGNHTFSFCKNSNFPVSLESNFKSFKNLTFQSAFEVSRRTMCAYSTHPL